MDKWASVFIRVLFGDDRNGMLASAGCIDSVLYVGVGYEYQHCVRPGAGFLGIPSRMAIESLYFDFIRWGLPVYDLEVQQAVYQRIGN